MHFYRFVRVIRDDRDRADRCPQQVRSIELATLKEWCGLAPDEKIPRGLFTRYLMPPEEVPWDQPEPHSVLFVKPNERPKDIRLHSHFVVHDDELEEDGSFQDPWTSPVSFWVPGSFLHEHMKKAFQAAGIPLRYLQPPDDLVLRRKIAEMERHLRDRKDK